MEALGRNLDVGAAFPPTDAVAGAITGLRCHLQNAAHALFVMITTGAGADSPVVNFSQCTASTGGTKSNLSTVVRYHYKIATTLDNSEVWVKATQAASNSITLAAAQSKQLILAVEFDAASLSDGYEWVEADMPDLGASATRFCAGLWLATDLDVQRAPAALAGLLA